MSFLGGAMGEKMKGMFLDIIEKAKAAEAAKTAEPKPETPAVADKPAAAVAPAVEAAPSKIEITDDDPRLKRTRMLNMDGLVKAGMMTPLTQRLLANDPSRISDREYRGLVRTALTKGMPENDLYLSDDNQAFISGYANARKGA